MEAPTLTLKVCESLKDVMNSKHTWNNAKKELIFAPIFPPTQSSN